MTRPKKALAGGVGGVCLVLLKLVDAKFYLLGHSTTEMLVGYLSYLAIVVLGISVAAYFSDDELPEPKIAKNAFILGLLAPSLLTAILTSPIQVTSPGPKRTEIPKIDLGQWLFSNAYAQANLSESGTPAQQQPTRALRIIPLKRVDIEPSAVDAWLKILGRKGNIDQYALIVGRSMNEDDARKAAKIMGTSFFNAATLLEGQPQWGQESVDVKSLLATMKTRNEFVIYKPVTGSDYYITAGTFRDFQAAKAAERVWKLVAFEALKSAELDADSKKAASAMLAAQVVPGQVLFEK